jgi:hypothetical protein
MVLYYGATQLFNFIEQHKIHSFDALINSLPQAPARLEWINVGGQLMPANAVKTLFSNIKDHTIDSWEAVHEFYQKNGALYTDQKFQHSYASLLELLQIKSSQFTPVLLKQILLEALQTKEWLTQNIYDSRAKDYQNDFKKMVYNNAKEMEEVIGKLDENVFIGQQQKELEQLRLKTNELIEKFQL